jgi:SAM-dependent methyltransferase
MDFTNYDHLIAIRKFELAQVMRHFPPKSKILEVGAGAGWQSKELSKLGYEVYAIDLQTTNYQKHIEFEVIFYDGRHIPFPNDFFDIVFSSNVLEHVPNLTELSSEIKRVTRKDGVILHILPSSSWRFWTLVAYFPDLFRKFHFLFLKLIIILINVWKRKMGKNELNYSEVQNELEENKVPRSSLTTYLWIKIVKFFRIIFPGRHGERGNSITEIYYFSRFFWIPFFQKNGFKITEVGTTKLFYTGYGILANHLNIEKRKKLARWLGASCNTYILKIAKKS